MAGIDLYKWAKQKFGDDADSMSDDQIKAAYDQENPPTPSDDAISQQATLNPDDGTVSDYEKEMDEWWGSEQRHPDDDALYKAMTPGEKAWLKSLPNTPGLQERMQFIRATPEDRKKIMGQMNEADQEAYRTGGQGVKGATPGAPFTQTVLGDTQTSEQEAEKLPPKQETNTQVDWVEEPTGLGDGRTEDAKGRYKLKSIWDAYNEGEIDDKTRDYMTVDALSKGLRGFSKDMANVGAAYSGGTMQDSTPEESLWQQRNREMMNSAIESEKAGVDNSREDRAARMQNAQILTQKYNNLAMEERAQLAKIVQRYARNAPNDTIRVKYLSIASQMYNGANVSDRDMAWLLGGEVGGAIWNALGGN